MAEPATIGVRVEPDGTRTTLPKVKAEPVKATVKPGKTPVAYKVTHEMVGRPGDTGCKNPFRQFEAFTGVENPPYAAKEFEAFGPEGLQRLLDLGAIAPVYED